MPDLRTALSGEPAAAEIVAGFPPDLQAVARRMEKALAAIRASVAQSRGGLSALQQVGALEVAKHQLSALRATVDELDDPRIRLENVDASAGELDRMEAGYRADGLYDAPGVADLIAKIARRWRSKGGHLPRSGARMQRRRKWAS